MKINLLASGLFAMLAVQIAYVSAAEPLDMKRFEELHKELRPDSNAKWRSIPWKISLLDAQAAAAESQKPVFVWAMDGHPLGCT